ncbi:MAG: hypothetical protein CL677_05160 [Bdellovibrionaceae bacterium]|nr:hypothetical protein [Pseudobdellovibrionaceae bacterium]|tara:strand:- start:1609 stop:1983 length:375 start_codon:yes stop_codon:yes gene_type:complete
MNIKSVANTINAIENTQKASEKKAVKSESSHQDRDADGRRQQEHAPEKEFLSDEEVAKVLEAIKQFPGIKDNHLNVSVDRVGDRVFFILTDSSLKVVRRMTTAEAWNFVAKDKESNGHILDKAM